MGGANQQERLSIAEAKRWFLAGFIEGEGSLCVSIKAHPTCRFGYLVDPEFFLYQHRSGIRLLELAKEIFGSGRIAPKSLPSRSSLPGSARRATCRRGRGAGTRGGLIDAPLVRSRGTIAQRDRPV